MVKFEISNLEFVKHEFLPHTMNFGIGSAFSKGLGSTFSEVPGPGRGPLYKVYLMKVWYNDLKKPVDLKKKHNKDKDENSNTMVFALINMHHDN